MVRSVMLFWIFRGWLDICVRLTSFWKKLYKIQKMITQQRKFIPEYNDAIIRLIKHKFLPLHQSKASLHHLRNPPSVKQLHSSNIAKQASLPSLPSAIHHTLLVTQIQADGELLERARQHIDSHRKERPTNWQKIELKQYIQLFQKPIQHNDRGKRGSIQFSLMEFDTRQRLQPSNAINANHQTVEMNQEERSIMNAKIRRKLNHRKIIDLAKRP